MSRTLYHVSIRGDRLVFADSRFVQPRGHRYDGAVRGLVGGFSPRSASRLRDYLWSSVASYRSLITLTYPADSEAGRNDVASKRHLACWFKRLRRELGGRGSDRWQWSSWCWFREYTKRGVIHYHIFGTHYVDRHWLSRSWWQACGRISDAHLRSGTNVCSFGEGEASRRWSAKYAWKYAWKSEQKGLPPGLTGAGRWWGVVGYRKTRECDVEWRGEIAVVNGCYDARLPRVINDFIAEIAYIASREPERLRRVALPDQWLVEWGTVYCWKINDLGMQERLLSMALELSGQGVCKVDYR